MLNWKKNTIKFPLHKKHTVHMIAVKCEITEIIVAISNRSNNKKKWNGEQKAQQALLFEGMSFSPSRVD